MNPHQPDRFMNLLRNLLSPINPNEPRIGYRAWWLKDGVPFSINTHVAWPFRKLFRAEHCGVGDAPFLHDFRDCPYTRPCGIYAMKNALNPSKLLHFLNRFMNLRVDNIRGVAGECYLGGRIIEHSYGYLAQLAYPKRIYSAHPSLDAAVVLAIEENYGIPVVEVA